MMIWKWPLSQIILDACSLRKHLVKYSEGVVPNVDEVGVIGVRKNQYTFHKKKRGSCDFKGATSRINKVLLEEFVQNVSTLTCYGMNCF
jgi:hypothetical protein